MRVFFDHQTFVLQEYGGISRYFVALVSALAGRPDIEAKVVAPLFSNQYLTNLGSSYVVGIKIPRIPKATRPLLALNRLIFDVVRNCDPPDIIHETYYFGKKGRADRRSKTVVTVYDMIHEIFPENFPSHDVTSLAKKKAIERADIIICISNNTAEDLIKIFDVDKDRLRVVHLGYDYLSDGGVSSKSLVGSSPFILYVGARRGYKNFEALVRAYASSTWLKKEVRIVCFGGGEFSSDERRLFRDMHLTGAHVIHAEGNDDRLAALYKGAVAFIYPSLYEGFGIPPLEAMSLGCPVVCSNTSSLPEVVGSSAQLFDPRCIESMRAAIEYVVSSTSRRSELKKFGLERCKMFSWTRCGNETLSVYKEVLG